MNKRFWHCIFFSVGCLLIIGCSTRKPKFLNRNFHAVTTKYNVLYNGQVAYDQAKQQIDDKYNDNFWEILPIEPLKLDDEREVLSRLPGQKPKLEAQNAQGFEKAELKAIKAVQKHSMEINGKEHNRQIDDAYLLLGKTRYYSQRFVPALEAFNFILGTYTDTKLKDETKIWQAKTLVRLKNEKLALETLDYLLNDDNLPLEIIENAYTTKAMVYESLDSTPQIIKSLQNAVLYSVNPKLKARNLFILGQLYRKEQKIDSSNIAFDQLINFRKAPYRYKIHAEIDRVKNYSKTDSTELVLKKLYKLIKDRDNRPFLDELYYQTATVELKNDSVNTAIKLLNKSLRTKDAKLLQKELTYEQLGSIYFEEANFKLAGAYYDSVLQIATNKNNKRIRRIARKAKSLEEVIFFENIATVNDSILRIAKMPEVDQKAYYQKYIDELKAKDEAAKEKAAIIAANQNTGFGNFGSSSIGDKPSGKFYFYSARAVGFGEQEFKRIWGDRPLEDNWRLSDKKIIQNTNNDNLVANSQQKKVADSLRYDVSYYLKGIPKNKKALDSLHTERNDAYYQLGLIYKEQFKEYQLAANKLEKLLTMQPAKNLIVPTQYHLYKIYENLDVKKSNKYKDVIVREYPDSRYSKIIQNPTELVSDFNANSPEAVYKAIYCDYDYEHYERALQNTENAIKQFEDLPIIPKFELLKAYLLLKTKNKEAFAEALEYVSLSFPNTKEGKHAAGILEDLKK